MSTRKESALYIQTLINANFSDIDERSYILPTPASFVIIESYKLPSVGIVPRGGDPDKSKPTTQYWKRNYDIYVYQSIWKPEVAMIGGTGSTKGVLELVDDLEDILNGVSDPANGIVNIQVTSDLEPVPLIDYESEGLAVAAGLKILMFEE